MSLATWLVVETPESRGGTITLAISRRVVGDTPFRWRATFRQVSKWAANGGLEDYYCDTFSNYMFIDPSGGQHPLNIGTQYSLGPGPCPQSGSNMPRGGDGYSYMGICLAMLEIFVILMPLPQFPSMFIRRTVQSTNFPF